MSVYLPIATLAALGCCFGVLGRRWRSDSWIGVFAGACAATVIWEAAVYALFLVFAPSELGPPDAAPLFYAFLTALAGASAGALASISFNRHRRELGGEERGD